MSDSKTITPNGIDVLGKLYNCMTSPYARKDYVGQTVVSGISDATDFKTELIDQESGLSYQVPSMLEIMGNMTKDCVCESASSYTEFTERLGKRVGITGEYGAFSGEVSVNLSISETTIDENCYTTVIDSRRMADVSFYESQLDDGSSGLTVDENFLEDLNNADLAPADFFKSWGTHIICGVKIGGQVRYTTFSSTSVYESASDFEVDAEVKYLGMSGSVNVEASSSHSTEFIDENVESGSNLLVYGGGEEELTAVGDGNSDTFSNWQNSVDENPEFMEFLPDGLIPVWNLCDDDDRKDALEATFLGYFVTTLYVDNKTCVYANGGYGLNTDDASDLGDDLEAWVETKSVTEYVVPSNEYQVMTGFGVTVSTSDFHVKALKGEYFNLKTGETTYKYDGGGSDSFTFEVDASVPVGSVMTGIGLRESNGDAKNMKIAYQEIDMSSPSNGYLSDDYDDVLDPKNSALDEYEIQYFPEIPRNQVITGIAVASSSLKKAFVRLALEVGELKVKLD